MVKDIIGPLMNGSTPMRVLSTQNALLSMLPQPGKANLDTLNFNIAFAEMMQAFSQIGLDKMTVCLMPGEAGKVNKVEYFSPHKAELVTLLNASFNPHGIPITEGDLLLTEIANSGEADTHSQVLSALAVSQTGTAATEPPATATTAAAA